MYSNLTIMIIVSFVVSFIIVNTLDNIRTNIRWILISYSYDTESVKKTKELNNIKINHNNNRALYISYFHHPWTLPQQIEVSTMIEPNLIQNRDISTKTGIPLIKNMHVSSELVKFIVQYEGYAGMLPPLKGLEGDTYGLYNDPQGNCTVGVGHLVHFDSCNSKDIESHKQIFKNGETKADALRILNEDLIYSENDVKDNVKVPLTQQQFDAIVDFNFNEGTDNLKSSKLLKDINEGNLDPSIIKNDFLVFTRDNLLIDRRIDEAKIFNNNIYNSN